MWKLSQNQAFGISVFSSLSKGEQGVFLRLATRHVIEGEPTEGAPALFHPGAFGGTA